MNRQVWPEAIGVSPQGSVSLDGKLVTYVDWLDSGNLAIRNLETGENRRLTDTANGTTGSDDGMSFANESQISPDGERVVYSWYRQNPVGDSTELRLLPLGGAAEQPRTIWSPGDGSYASVQDWFPSGDRVAAVVSTSDNTSRIVTVSLDDGGVRLVRSAAVGLAQREASQRSQSQTQLRWEGTLEGDLLGQLWSPFGLPPPSKSS